MPAFWFILPSAAVLAVVFLAPILYSLKVSFFGWSLVMPGSEHDFVGLANYLDILTNPDFADATVVTLIYALSAIAIELPLGLGFAVLLNQSFYGRALFRSGMMIPMVVTPSVLGIFWRLYYDTESGLFNYFLAQLGLGRVDWLGLDRALLSIILMDVWQMTPFFMLILLAGLQSRDQEMLEAARVDGAGPLQSFRFLTLPHLLPYILVACSFRLIGAMGDFDKIFLLTGGGPGNVTTTLSVFAYKMGFSAFEIGRTAAIAWLYMAIVLVISSPLIIYLNIVSFRTDR